jgi:VCBS repeat-containing protein
LSSLQDNQTVVGTYAVTVSDGQGGTATQDITIDLTRGPDLTVVTPSVSTTINALPAATGSSATDQQSGVVTFADPDALDTPTASLTPESVVWTDANGNIHQLSTSQIAAFTQALTISPESGNTNDGTIDWNYAIANSSLAFLGAGETVAVSAEITVSDGHGGTVDTPVTITVNGVNNPPVIAANDVSISASITAGSTPGSMTLDQQSSSIAFTDLTADNLPTASVTSQTAVWTDASGNTHNLSSTELSEIEAAFTIAAAAGNTNNGSENWLYSIPDADLNFLAQGDHVVLTNVVTISDGQGGSDSSDVVITLNGTNDAPTIPTNPGVTSETITKLANTTGSNTLDTASGTFAFNDVNLNDHHTLTETLVSDTLSSGSTIPAATLSALANGLGLTETDSTGSGSGSVTWNFSAADKNFDFLAQGQSITAVYDIGIADGHGGSVTEPVSVTINGAYAPPTITTAQLTGSVTGASTAASGVIHFTDPELIDTHTIESVSLLSTTAQPLTDSLGNSGAIGALGTLTASLAADSTNGATGAIDWSYNLTGLPQGSPVTETWGIVMQDASGHQVTEDVAITISQASSQVGLAIGFETTPNGDTYNTDNGGYAAMGFGIIYGPNATANNEESYSFQIDGSDPYYVNDKADLIQTNGYNVAAIPNNHLVTIKAIPTFGPEGGPTLTFQVAIPIDSSPITQAWENAHSVVINPAIIHI